MAKSQKNQRHSIEEQVRQFTRQWPDVAYSRLAQPHENLIFHQRANGRYEAYGSFFGKSKSGALSIYGSDSPTGQCGWAYKSEKGDVFQFVQKIHGISSREEAIIRAGQVLLEIHGTTSQILKWDRKTASENLKQARQERAEADDETLATFSNFFPTQSELFSELGYDPINDGYYVPYYVGGRPVAVEWASLTQNVMYFHHRTPVHVFSKDCYRGTFPCLSETDKKKDHRLMVLTDHAESAAAIRQFDIDAFGLLRGNNKPSLSMLDGLQHRKIVVIGHNTPGGRQFRTAATTFLRNRGFDAEFYAFPEEEYLPSGLTVFDVLKNGGSLEINHRNQIELDVPSLFYDIATAGTVKRFNGLRLSYARLPALIALAPTTRISANSKLVYNYLLVKQVDRPECTVDNDEFSAAVGLKEDTRRRAIKELENLGLLRRVAPCRYSVVRHEPFGNSSLAHDIFAAMESRVADHKKRKRNASSTDISPTACPPISCEVHQVGQKSAR